MGSRAAWPPSSTIEPGATGGFGAARGLSLRGIVLTAAAHAAALPLALSFGQQVVARPEERLVMVDLTPPAPPPPPPPSAAPQPSAAPPPLTAPATAVKLALSEAPLAPPQPAVPTSVTPMLAPAQSAAAGSPSAAPAAAAPAIITSDALDATLVSGAPPRYPHDSRRKREQGTVELLVIVGTDGRVETISLASSSGSARLDEAALKAVRGWRWQPVRHGGQAVKVRGIVTIPFVLTSHRKSHARADCDSPDSRCRPDDAAARDHRGGRMDRRDGDLGHPGPDGEE